jgi:hypothetical protein
MMRSKVKLLLEGAADQQPLLSFVDRTMTSSERRSILEVSVGRR